MSKFTPGPWAHTNGIIFVGEPENVPDSQIRIFKGIAEMRACSDVVANTALIAAAPEVYQALEELFFVVPKGNSELVDVKLNKALNALKKARGES